MKILVCTLLAASTCLAANPPAKAPAPQRIELAVTSDGFTPAQVKVKAGQPVTLVVTRKTEKTCATEIVLKDLNIKKALPMGTPVEVSFTPAKTGSIRYACAMDMIAGVILVE